MQATADNKIEFSSLTELGAYVQEASKTSYCHKYKYSKTRQTERSWDWNLGLAGAIKILTAGGSWAEGAERMRRGVIEARAKARQILVPAIENDVAGFAPDVPAFLAGDPESMLAMGDEEMQAAEVIRLGVHVGKPYDFSADCAFNRGIAIMSAVDALESAGKRVELWAVWRNQSALSIAYVDVLIKAADQDWSPAAAAFAIAHPAFSRRVAFAAAELRAHQLETSGQKKAASHWLGVLLGEYGIQAKRAEKGFDLYFPRPKGEADWGTIDSSLAAVAKILKAGPDQD